MATLDELEASLRAKWDRDTLAVYADHLQSLGELRGELIVIDLRIEEAGPLPELVARRKELLAAWLKQLPPGKVQHGFLDIDATGGDPVEQIRAALASPAVQYIRTIAVVGSWKTIREVVSIISAAPRPALVRLVLRQWDDGEAPSVDARMFQQFIAATPALDTLEVDGYIVFGNAVHPAVRRLRISGWNAIESLSGTGAPWPSLVELDFAFACHLGSRHQAPNGKLLARATAVHSLDLSRNEPGRTDPINLGLSVDPFLFLRELALPLRELRLPTVSTAAQLIELRRALVKFSGLEHVAIRGAQVSVTHPTAKIVFF